MSTLHTYKDPTPLPRTSPVDVLSREDAHEASSQRIGGKAKGLVMLDALGVPVPSWYVLPSEAFVTHLTSSPRIGEVLRQAVAFDALDLEGDEERARSEAAALSRAFQALILDAPFEDRVICALRGPIADLLSFGEGGIAVRSSMVGEDGTSHSFAGQLDSFLYLKSEETILDAVRKCWASAYSLHALMYKRGAGMSAGILPVAVILQVMIEGEASGVMFTAHPTSGHPEQILISSAWGSGEGVVSGACDTDTFVWSRARGDLSCQIANKDREVCRNEEGEGTYERAIEDERRRMAPSLKPHHVSALADLAILLDSVSDTPFDVEWTLRGDDLFVLQARPITCAIAIAADKEGARRLFDNSNIQESYCGVTTPLTYSFAAHAYREVYIQTFRLLGVSDRKVRALAPTLDNLLGLIEGRIYYNLQSWYEGLTILPSFGKNKADMEAMMGVSEPVDFVEDEVLTPLQMITRLPRLGLTLMRFKRRFATIDADVTSFLSGFEALADAYPHEEIGQMSLSQATETLRLLEERALARWDVPIVNDFYCMMSVGRLRRMIERAGVDAPDEMMADLLGGEEGIESTEPTRLLMECASHLRRDASIEWSERASTYAPLDLLSLIESEAPDVWEEIERYIARYGDRTMGELKLETRTLRQDRSFLGRILGNYLVQSELHPETLRAQERERRRGAERALAARLRPLDRMRMRRVVRQARQSVKHRENTRLARTRLFGLFRSLYLCIGARLHEAHKLDSPRDIFYLTRDEIIAFVEGRAVTRDLSSLVALRREEFEGYEECGPPHRIETFGAVYIGNPFDAPVVEATEHEAHMLHGTGCYSGRVRAKLRVIRCPDEVNRLDGRILTTLRTDPGWAPLFPSASGILVERGSTLSHSAVVARELGIPAIVGVPNLLAIVEDGEEVTLDGGRGEVRRHIHDEGGAS